ncbi:MAG TPA: DUF1549 domain-containing protein [Blastocatellia bacterium]|nr:DUF1549 domain-containing protein [Blastocatellia bacterium]
MPTTEPKKSSGGQKINKYALLLIVIVAAAAALDQMSAAAQNGRQDGGKKEEYAKTTRDDCSYLQNPDTFRGAMATHRDLVSRSTEMISQTIISGIDEQTEISLVPPQEIPRKNFIDNILFDRMGRDNVMSAQITTDAEFIRRVYLDITGRIPSAADVTAFLADTAANKREALVDKLIGSPEYIDKWTMFFSDLFKVTARSTNVVRYSGGRDAFYNYIKNSIATNKSYAQMAMEMVTAMGDNFVDGQNNFIIGCTVPMGPNQDTFDGSAVNTASMFLGINTIDCLLCHNGAGHLESVNLWASQRTRAEAWGMSAFFARVRRQRQVLSQQPNYAKFIVSEANVGEYQLNTDSGNRQPRFPINGVSTVQPRYIFNGAGVNQGENRRQAMARHVTSDFQFARAAVNYVWEKLMVEALVSPSNTFDPARLDPAAQLPPGWSLQPANAELLKALADDFVKSNYNIRALIATIAKSSAYQLSSQYPGNWSLALVPYYARKFARRLDAEEIHDSIVKASGISVNYQIRDSLGQPTYTVNWAMQLPDPAEPRGNRQALNFLNAFIRGDRDVKPRSLEPSIMQALNMMNHQFVMARIHNNNNGSNVQKLLADQSLTPAQITTQLYLNTLSRNPAQSELDKLTPLFASLGRQQAAETIQWALLNKVDFIFNY